MKQLNVTTLMIHKTSPLLERCLVGRHKVNSDDIKPNQIKVFKDKKLVGYVRTRLCEHCCTEWIEQ